MSAAADPVARRRLFVPEVIQTSSMDCGPAALKSLLEGFGVAVHYGRLREACHTAVDGTSIGTLESVADLLGLRTEQIVVPLENLLLSEAAALPALVVVTLPSGLFHFVVVWRVHGPWVQVMDPGRGRRWMRRRDLLREVYVHESAVSLAEFHEWVETDGFRDPLRERLRRAGVDDADELLKRALAGADWRSIAAVDASVRAVEELVHEGVLPKSHAGKAVVSLVEAAWRTSDPRAVIGEDHWTVRAADGAQELLMRGAVLLRVLGPKQAEESRSSEGATPGHPRLPSDLAAALDERETRPATKLLELLRLDGIWRWPPLLVGLALAAAGAVFEALLFRGFFDMGRHLALYEQRLGAVIVLVLLGAGLLGIEWPVARQLWGMGRRLEVRLRKAFLEKIPRLGDRYFQSRPVSDMAERAHLVHWLRILPGVGGNLVRTVCELMVTAAGIIWLHPGSAPVTLGLAVAMVAIPLLFQPALIERDLRMRAHAGGLSRFYLDALLGLVAIRAHAAEGAVRHEHADRLVEWARAARDGTRSVVWVDTVQALSGFGLAAWVLFDYLTSAPGSGWALLLVYWALSLPALGQELAFFVQQYPQHRNVTLRLLEPLSAREDAGEPDQSVDEGAANGAERNRPGVEVRFEEVVLQMAGHELLAVDELVVRGGSHVAIVGVSGAGKSSLAGAVLGWYPPTQGRVLVDGDTLTGRHLGRLRHETVWIEPGVYLWNRSLLDNLRYGAEDESGPVGTAIEEADLDEVLGRLPTGLQTPLGEGGALLSGGEGQRVRFGRAMCRAPTRLVVLDEAFRGLERRRRRLLLARARKRWSSATFFCITHDISDTLEFDRVLVVDGGRIVEDGVPRELIRSKESRYGRLIEAERRVTARVSGDSWRQLTIEKGRVVETRRQEVQ